MLCFVFLVTRFLYLIFLICVLRVLAFGVGAVEARSNRVHASKDRVAAAVEIVEVIVPHVCGVAERVPGEDDEFGSAARERLGFDGVGSLAVLLGIVVEDGFGRVVGAVHDVRAVVGSLREDRDSKESCGNQ